MSGRRSVTVLGLLLGVAAAGCATHADRLRDVRTAYYNGHVESAKAKIDASLQKHPRDADVLKLERAVVLLSEGQPKQAEALLREVRDHFDHLEQKDLAEGVVALLTDDQRRAYAGEDYEKVLLRVFLALSSLVGDGQDAAAYALQVSAKQQEIIQAGATLGDNPKQNYKQVAIGPYLHAAVREQTHTDYDDAARSLQLVCQWAPEFRAGQHDLERLQRGRHSEPGHGVVYVVTLVGRGPYKEERWEIPTTAALLVADRILSLAGKHTLPPTVAPIKVPRVVSPPNDVHAVRVTVDGQGGGQTETITDVGRLAREQADALLPTVIGRAVARRVVTKAAVYGVKEAVGKEKGDVVNVALDVAGVVWEATESADTRCWGLLPDKIQVLRLELPAGHHLLSLQPVGGYGTGVGPIQSATVPVEDGRSTFVLANFPTGRLAGKIVSSKEPQ